MSRGPVIAVMGAMLLVGGLVAVVIWAPSLRTGPGPGTRRTVSFRGEPIAIVDESVVDPPGPVAQRVVRDTEILGSGGHTRLHVELDDLGFAIAARYERPGARTFERAFERTVELRPDGVVVVDGKARLKLQPPVVVVDVLHRVRSTSPLAVTVFEPASAETLSARLTREGPALVVRSSDNDEVLARALPEGPRHGPGAFAEGDVVPERAWAPVEVLTPGRTGVGTVRLAIGPTPPTPDDPVADDHTRPGPFIESDDDGVRAFALPLCSNDPLDTARRLGEAIRPRVDASARLSAPGARQMLRVGGDCDGAATLAVAGLRACGHPARVVVGYALVAPGAGARLVPHAVAEVYRRATGGSGRWWRLDPTVPSLTDHDDRFVPVAAGPGGALTMGRVLGLVDERDLIASGGSDARP